MAAHLGIAPGLAQKWLNKSKENGLATVNGRGWSPRPG